MRDSVNGNARCNWPNRVTSPTSAPQRRPGKKSSAIRRRLCLSLLALALCGLYGCATLAPPAFQDPVLQECAETYRALSRQVDGEGVRDAAFHRIAGFPYLRSSRFLGGFAAQMGGTNREQVEPWLQRMNQLAVEGLLLESQQLPRPAERELGGRLRDCGGLLVAEVSRRPDLVAAIARRSQPSDHYQAWKRWLGLYPISALPFRRGVVNEHRHIKALEQAYYRAAPEAQPFNRYAPAARGSARQALLRLREAPQDSLGIPVLSRAVQEQLLAAWAPAWQVEAGAANDRIGALRWNDRGQVDLDPANPKVYTAVTYGRYGDQVTVQLNYSVWFSGRLPKNRWDLLAGKLDGLIWRVHLLPSGRVLAGDTIHNCGCWYQLYPADGFTAEVAAQLYDEPVYVGGSEHIDFEQPLTLTLQANTHLLIAVENDKIPAPGAQPLAAVPYNELRALPTPRGQRRSLFAENGLVPVSRRGERWLFWPMGVASPGAMRIKGTHAIAFIGRRHFDDPALLDILRPNNIGGGGQ